MDIYARIREELGDVKETRTRFLVEKLGGDPNRRRNQMLVAGCLKCLGFSGGSTWRNGKSVRLWMVAQYKEVLPREFSVIDGDIYTDGNFENKQEMKMQREIQRTKLKELRLLTVNKFNERLSSIESKLDAIMQRLDGK